MANKEKINQTQNSSYNLESVSVRKDYRGMPNNPGDKYVIPTRYFIDDVTGEQKSEPDYDAKYNLHERIQASAESCDLHVIAAKYFAGDKTVINVRTPLGVSDTTQLPKNEYDMANLARSSHDAFNKLPDDIKALFDNDPTVYLDSILKNESMNIVNDYLKSKQTKTEVTE